ncbi:hypothetical protein Tco_1017424 [Tanacetum coccineum]|uniref:Uncharacterized protein n=1 Tax=Tanacetum coccineum TaxID=301880 RepID=A0ABQ5FSI5_9ASTR
MFVDYRTNLVEGSSKRAGDELEQEVTKKQKVDDVQETAEVDDNQEATKIKELTKIVSDEEEVTIDLIPLATKPPTIVDYKIYKEGKKNYYQIIIADRSSKMGRIVRLKASDDGLEFLCLIDVMLDQSKLVLLENFNENYFLVFKMTDDRYNYQYNRKEHGENIMKSIKEGHFRWERFRCYCWRTLMGAVQHGPVRALSLSDLSAGKKKV